MRLSTAALRNRRSDRSPARHVGCSLSGDMRPNIIELGATPPQLVFESMTRVAREVRGPVDDIVCFARALHGEEPSLTARERQNYVDRILRAAVDLKQVMARTVLTAYAAADGAPAAKTAASTREDAPCPEARAGQRRAAQVIPLSRPVRGRSAVRELTPARGRD